MSLGFPLRLAPRLDVLVVGDNPFMRAAVSRILQRGGRQCVAVASIDAAKMTLLEHPPALVITDFSLTGRESGVDLVRWIRSQPSLDAVSCGVMSGSDKEALDEALRDAGLGSLPVLQKPFGLDELETWVDVLLAPLRNARPRNEVS